MLTTGSRFVVTHAGSLPRRCFERHPLPDDMVLVSGVSDTTSNYVEHPEVVAERLATVARSVGDPRRVIAGTDCRFDQSAGKSASAD